MARAIARFALLALSCVVVSVFAASAAAAEPLFPTPLHITRQVHDPITDRTFVLEEYAQGNRLVSVSGAKTSIADYDKGELTEIDRDAATYSVTRFEAIAKAAQAASVTKTENLKAAPRSTGMKATKLGRNAEFFETDIESGGMKQRVAVGLDPVTTVSKEALEVLLGAAYPGTHRPEHDAVISAAGTREHRGPATNATQRLYALPIEQSMTVDLDGQHLELRTSVVRLGNETPPADLVSIPPGARLVTSRIVAVQQELERQTQQSSTQQPPTQHP